MKQQLKPNAELDLLTEAELRSVVEEVASGYLRPPQRIRVPGGLALDGSGNAAVTPVYVVEAGMKFVLTRIEFIPDGYTMRAPATVTSGGIDLYVDGQWRDGVPFGSGSGQVGSLPCVYTQSESRAVEAEDGAQLEVAVAGGPASRGLAIAVVGFLFPLPPVG